MARREKLRMEKLGKSRQKPKKKINITSLFSSSSSKQQVEPEKVPYPPKVRFLKIKKINLI